MSLMLPSTTAGSSSNAAHAPNSSNTLTAGQLDLQTRRKSFSSSPQPQRGDSMDSFSENGSLIDEAESQWLQEMSEKTRRRLQRDNLDSFSDSADPSSANRASEDSSRSEDPELREERARRIERLKLNKKYQEVVAKIDSIRKKIDNEQKVRSGFDRLEEAYNRNPGFVDEKFQSKFEKKFMKSDLRMKELEKKLSKYLALQAAMESGEYPLDSDDHFDSLKEAASEIVTSLQKSTGNLIRNPVKYIKDKSKLIGEKFGHIGSDKAGQGSVLERRKSMDDLSGSDKDAHDSSSTSTIQSAAVSASVEKLDQASSTPSAASSTSPSSAYSSAEQEKPSGKPHKQDKQDKQDKHERSSRRLARPNSFSDLDSANMDSASFMTSDSSAGPQPPTSSPFRSGQDEDRTPDDSTDNEDYDLTSIVRELHGQVTEHRMIIQQLQYKLKQAESNLLEERKKCLDLETKCAANEHHIQQLSQDLNDVIDAQTEVQDTMTKFQREIHYHNELISQQVEEGRDIINQFHDRIGVVEHRVNVSNRSELLNFAGQKLSYVLAGVAVLVVFFTNIVLFLRNLVFRDKALSSSNPLSDPGASSSASSPSVSLRSSGSSFGSAADLDEATLQMNTSLGSAPSFAALPTSMEAASTMMYPELTPSPRTAHSGFFPSPSSTPSSTPSNASSRQSSLISRSSRSSRTSLDSLAKTASVNAAIAAATFSPQASSSNTPLPDAAQDRKSR